MDDALRFFLVVVAAAVGTIAFGIYVGDHGASHAVAREVCGDRYELDGYRPVCLEPKP